MTPSRPVQHSCCAMKSRPARASLSKIEHADGRVQVVTYMAQGKETDGRPSLRYITLIREGARGHGLPTSYIRFLEDVGHAE